MRLFLRTESAQYFYDKALLQYYSVLQSTTPYYKVLLQHYSITTAVLLCATKYYPVLLCTTKYYSSNTKYYSVLQSTTPVLLRTTKYYSSTTPYWQSTTPVLLLEGSITWRFYLLMILLRGGSSPFELLLRHVPWLLTGNRAKRM